MTELYRVKTNFTVDFLIGQLLATRRVRTKDSTFGKLMQFQSGNVLLHMSSYARQYASFPFNNFICVHNRFRRMQIAAECRGVAAKRVTHRRTLRFVVNYNYDFANSAVVSAETPGMPDC